ncbi:hypothetical protein Aperf_G00000019599 [Anoplocephala perfoliata]
MDCLVPESVITQLGAEISSTFRDSLLLFSSGSAYENTRPVVSELLLNAANRTAVEEERRTVTSVAYFRPCELVSLSRLHIHCTPPFDFANWDSIRFYDKPTEDSLISFFSQIHLTDRIPDLIIIEQLDRMIGPEREDFLARLHALTCLFTDSLEHLHWRRAKQQQTSSSSALSQSGSLCRLLVSCTLPTNIWSGRSALSSSFIPHGLHQACLFTEEDDSHFSLADITGVFELKLCLKETELFFSSFVLNADLLRLRQPPTESV